MLDKKTINKLKEILFRSLDLKRDKVFIFGSRAVGDARKFSDIDIGIISSKPIPMSKISDIKEKFEESAIPYTVDLVDFSQAGAKFKDLALQKVIYLN